MAFAIKGQTKAAAAFKGTFGVYGPIFFKLCVEVAYCSPGTPDYMAFTIKGQTKAAGAFKGNFGIYGPILLKFRMRVAYCSPGKFCYITFINKGRSGLQRYLWNLGTDFVHLCMLISHSKWFVIVKFHIQCSVSCKSIANKEKKFSNHTAFWRCFAICFGFRAERQDANWLPPAD